jgi:hypothetical protein
MWNDRSNNTDCSIHYPVDVIAPGRFSVTPISSKNHNFQKNVRISASKIKILQKFPPTFYNICPICAKRFGDFQFKKSPNQAL